MDNSNEIKKLSSYLIDVVRRDGRTKDVLSVLAILLFFKHHGELSQIKEKPYRDDFDYEWITDILSKVGHLDFLYILSEEIKKLKLSTIEELIYILNNELINENINELFEEIIRQSTSDISDGVGMDYQPDEISKFIYLLGDSTEVMEVYNPFAGLASYGIYFGQRHHYIGQEYNERIWALGKVRLILNNAYVYDYTQDDSIENWNSTRQNFDLVVSSPPMDNFSKEKLRDLSSSFHAGNLEDFVIGNSLFNTLKPTGKFIGLFSESLLFAGGHSYTFLRRQLVDSQKVEMIISLPSNIMYNTSIKTFILILNNKLQTKSIKFVNGASFIRKEKRKNIFEYEKLFQAIQENDSQFIRIIPNEEVKNNNYILSVNRYFIEEFEVPEGFREVSLGSLLTPYDSLYYDDSIDPEPMRQLVSVSTLSDNPYQYEIDLEKISELKPVSKCKMAVDDVLLISTVGKLKANYCYASQHVISYSQQILAYEVNTDKVDISYLINQLYSEYVQNQVKAFSVGAVMPRIKRKDLEKIRILLPASIEEQKAIAKSAKEAYQLASAKELGLEEVIESMQAEYMDDMRVKKHNLAQYVNGLQSSVSALIKFLNNNGGTISLEDLISKHRNINVESHLQSMLQITTEIGEFVNGLTNELNFEPAEKVKLNTFIKKFIGKYNTQEQFKINYIEDEDSFKDNRKINPITYISKQALTEVFNNIVENAKRHGFVEDRKDYEINILLSYNFDKEMIEIKFQNNGKPMPKGMDTFRFGLKNEKAGTTANEGIGGFRIKQIIQHYKGEFSICTDEDDEFPVTIQLYLSLIKDEQ